MRADFRTYVSDRPLVFERDLATSIRRLFGEHGLDVWFASSIKTIHHEWVRLAGDWSLTVPNRLGKVSTSRDPARLSHIKLAGLLAWCIAQAKPIAGFRPLENERRQLFEAMDWPHSIRENSAFLRSFPHEVCATAVSTGLFLAYQAGRDGKIIYEPARTPRTYHYDRNLAMFLREGRVGPESLYMIFKTMDLFGHEAVVVNVTG